MTPRMPIGAPLASSDIAAIEKWIRELPPRVVKSSEARWAFEKPVAKVPPGAENPGAGNPIDAFVTAKLEANQLKLASAAANKTLARRVYFDLVGVPPSPDEMAAFLSDASPDAMVRHLPAEENRCHLDCCFTN